MNRKYYESIIFLAVAAILIMLLFSRVIPGAAYDSPTPTTPYICCPFTPTSAAYPPPPSWTTPTPGAYPGPAQPGEVAEQFDTYFPLVR